jgi:hypothetical protein
MAYTYKPNKIATYRWFNQLTGYTGLLNTDNIDNAITYNNLKNDTNQADFSDLGIIPSIPSGIDGTKCAKESYIYSLFKYKDIVVNCDVKNITLGTAKNHSIALYAYLPNTNVANDAAQLPIKISVTIKYILNSSLLTTNTKTIEMTIPQGGFNISSNVSTGVSNDHIYSIEIANVAIKSVRYIFNPSIYARQHVYNVIIGSVSITSSSTSTTTYTYDFKSVINSFSANSTNINPNETNTYNYNFKLSYYRNNLSYSVAPTNITIEFENSNTDVTDDVVINSYTITPSTSTTTAHTFSGRITLKAADNVNGMVNFPKIFATVNFGGYKIKKLILVGSI